MLACQLIVLKPEAIAAIMKHNNRTLNQVVVGVVYRNVG